MISVWKLEPSQTESQQMQQTQSKAVLHLDDWIQSPKSKKHDKHIWSVVRLRIGPVTASLKWMKKHVQKASAHRSKDMHHFLLSNSLDPSSTIWTSSCWYFQIPIYTQKFVNLASSNDTTHLSYITKFTSWMPLTIGCLLENTQYGMLQS